MGLAPDMQKRIAMAKRMLTEADIIPPRGVRARTVRSGDARYRRHETQPPRGGRARIVTFYFECYETMWLQVQEMIYIEKGGAEQVPG